MPQKVHIYWYKGYKTSGKTKALTNNAENSNMK